MFRVLLVDDEQNILDGLTRLITWEDSGFTIAATAGDGSSALEILAGGDIDAVITDIRMVPMDGLELAGRIRQMENPVPVLIISAYQDFEYAQQAIEYGVSQYLLKPIAEKKLVAALAKIRKQLQEMSVQSTELAASSLLGMVGMQASEAGRQSVARACRALGIPAAGDYCCCVVTAAAQGAAFEEAMRRCAALPGVQKSAALLEVKNGRAIFLLHGAAARERTHFITQILGSGAAQVIATGKVVGDIFKIYRSYVTACNILYVMQAQAQPKIYQYDDFEDRPTSLNAAKWNAPELVNAILYGTMEDVDTHLGAFRKAYGSRKPSTTKSGIDLIAALWDVNEKALNSPEWEQQLMSFATLDEALSFVRAEIITFKAANRSAPLSLLAGTVRVVTDYVDANYANSHLSIKKIATDLNYNSAYLGRSFTAYKGISIKDYIYQVRIERSKELLRSTDKKIITVAHMVGIGDINLFYKLFKKYVGASPSEYRREP